MVQRTFGVVENEQSCAYALAQRSVLFRRLSGALVLLEVDMFVVLFKDFPQEVGVKSMISAETVCRININSVHAWLCARFLSERLVCVVRFGLASAVDC